jgi:hypothetical protein
MRTPQTDIAAVVAGAADSGGRFVLLPADIDRQYGRTRLPDLGELLAASIRQATPDLPISVNGPGYLCCTAYTHSEGVVVHIVNLSGLNELPGYVEELYPVGPTEVTVAGSVVENELRGNGNETARSLVTDARFQVTREPTGAISFAICEIADHEVVLITGSKEA